MDLFGIYPLVNEDTGFMRFLVSFPMKVSQVGVPLGNEGKDIYDIILLLDRCSF